MGIRVTYPNEGLYAGGKPRLEVFDEKTDAISFCREATVAEAMQYANTFAMFSMAAQLQSMEQQIRDVQTYGLRHQ